MRRMQIKKCFFKFFVVFSYDSFETNKSNNDLQHRMGAIDQMIYQLENNEIERNIN